MRRRLTEHVLFFREYLRNFHTTGAVLPSGRHLAAALARFVGEKGKGDRSNLPERPATNLRSVPGFAQIGPVPFSPSRRLLEVGPGTGAVTRRIIADMGPTDHIDLVELNDAFVEQLKNRFAVEPAFRAVADRARVLHCPVEDLPREQRYDAIVSGLPLNNFAVADVERILAALLELLAPGGTLSFFEYIGVRPARAVFSGRSGRARLRGVGAALRAVLDGREIRRDAVWLNVPPAWVHHVRK